MFRMVSIYKPEMIQMKRTDLLSNKIKFIHN